MCPVDYRVSGSRERGIEFWNISRVRVQGSPLVPWKLPESLTDAINQIQNQTVNPKSALFWKLKTLNCRVNPRSPVTYILGSCPWVPA